MSAQPAYSHLRAERGGQAAPLDLPPARMTPAQIPLTLSADVLRLRCSLNARAVLAEIVSLHAANAGRCDASDTHFTDRLSISLNTVSRAVQELEEAGFVVKVTKRLPTGFYRTLTPNSGAIAAAAATNPYPQRGARPTPKMGVAYPQNGDSPTPEMGAGLPPNWGSNTPLITTLNLHTPTDTASAAGGESEKKMGESEISHPALANPDASASHTEGGANDVATSLHPGRPAKVAPDESPAFRAFWAAYPRHDDTRKAAQAFARLSPEEQAEATDQAPAFFARRTDWISPTGTDYRPYAATWLNGKRWKECAEPLPTPSPQLDATHHATTRSTRPINGHKPAGAGGSMARALAERSQQQRTGPGSN